MSNRYDSRTVFIGTSTLQVQSTAYADNDVMGVEFDIPSGLQGSGATGILDTVIVYDLDTVKEPFDLVVFNSDPSTTFTNNSAMDVGDTDLDKIAGVVSFNSTSYTQFADNAVGQTKDIGLLLEGNGTSVLKGVLRKNGAGGARAHHAFSMRLGFSDK